MLSLSIPAFLPETGAAPPIVIVIVIVIISLCILFQNVNKAKSYHYLLKFVNVYSTLKDVK
jgi:hypothetical protein